ncbi:MAG TPA: hypothetical protein VHO25_08310, partial [Polyangiaceae bacterium]|nr:hypothetical protein [Polyangiaceae bacterium]
MPTSRGSASGDPTPGGNTPNPDEADASGATAGASQMPGTGMDDPSEEPSPDLSIPTDAGSNPNACQGLECQQTTCLDGACTQAACERGMTTTVSGIVHDPSGQLPLYNVTVYVPNGEVRAFTEGASCESCALTVEKPLAAAITDALGEFQLENVPVGEEIPLVVQIGKWRRQTTIAVE